MLANYVGVTKAAGAKDGQGIRSVEVREMLFVILAVVILLPIFLSAVIFVSIVWTHRPDLTVLDILRESMKEIQEIRNTRAGERNRRKGIRK